MTMRSRLQIHFKALTFSLSAVGALLFLAFFFYDGPLDLPLAEPTAQATVPNPLLAILRIEAKPEPAANPLSGILPVGYQAKWQQVSLDQDQVHLNVLKSPLLLSQTHHRTGSEAFQYASYLFDQMSKNVSSPAMSGDLQALSLQAQTMGNAVSQADAFQFSGPPTSNMNHLQVRSSILYYLSGLNPSPLVNVQYNQDGKVLAQDPGQATAVGPDRGEAINAFMERVDAVLSQPGAKAYPQTMQLVKQESALLKNLANHMTLRWESTLDCPKDCGNVAVYLRVYAHQTLPEQTLAAVTI